MAEGRADMDSGLRKLMQKIQQKVVSLSRQFDKIYAEIFSGLANKKIFFINQQELSEKQSRWLDQHFENKILRHIVPIWLTDSINLDDHLVAEVTYLVVEIREGADTEYAIIDVPDRIPRFMSIPPDRGHARNYFMVADEVSRCCRRLYYQAARYFDQSALKKPLT